MESLTDSSPLAVTSVSSDTEPGADLMDLEPLKAVSARRSGSRPSMSAARCSACEGGLIRSAMSYAAASLSEGLTLVGILPDCKIGRSCWRERACQDVYVSV